MYTLLVKSSADKDLRRLPEDLFGRINARTLGLGVDPRPAGAVKLTGNLAGWRLRVGDYCIVYQIDDAARTVTVVRVRHRRDMYR